MFDIMSRAQNAMEIYNAALDITSTNIANMDVTGYKGLSPSFQSIFENLIRSGTPASTFSNIGGTNPVQLGQGVGIANISLDFSQGALAESNAPGDLGIEGRGFFIVSNNGGSSYLYTRAGQFFIDSYGNLVTDKGMQLYGLNEAGTIAPITGLIGDWQQDYSWNEGTGELLYKGGSTGYKIALTYFQNPSGLEQKSGTTFAESLASGSPAIPLTVGGTAGNIKSGQLEGSNVFYTGESIKALEYQRAMSANLSMVKAASDMISQVISRLGS
ncbi:hypothetical protein A2526_02150 [candidate division WOR-1 bacterium RIFOXYD2_FULL_36_8]|uniref:Uncharacterized protein n=1 Tax=candidate division WOR-1 bacterium RIFOXYB2_FULL_36_35 TaxID=1802578 RepID=A0A1F4S498_UNCSA|nr:MAG: hypothetical protein A2230_06230 [candidate division WOR-1 bacterium RIFOXYA2_FULL_36_21]OGC14553.1 MAG: hypothetical protein A2290_01730 [candidate division WOR-1 bacterium RIFOXYB2_FULL_36_35]OGC16225.1 MAG: hypothetical protein A2282_01285 [candidate division WOR-1 bacterium RIFOXYA12_FULL_36_13]OGC38331.1 MAG: hypothetical protein A2526_02150 [candidate division WOR-1 bacterium RIFOXYD2_FULL_36_8]